MPYDVTGKTPEQLAADQQRALTDDIFLGEVLGYDFQEDVHRELFEQMPCSVPGKALADFDEKKGSLILWPRGHFKTSATVVRIVRIILNMPDVRILLMSATIKLTQNWLGEIKSHFYGKNPRSGLLQLFGSKWKLTKGSKMGFTVPTRLRMHLKDPTVAVGTPNSVSTGAHCDFFFADDLVNTKNYRKVELQDKLEEDFSNFVPLLDPGGYTVLTGTRYAGFDVYGRRLKKADSTWRVSVKQSRTDDKTWLLFPQRTLADGRKIGLTHDMLDQIMKDDPVMYNAQYMNRIVALNRHIFPVELLLAKTRSKKDERYPRNASAYFAIDLAESDNADTDDSVLAIGRRDANAAIWIEDVIGHTWTPGQFANVIINQAVLLRPEKIFIEKQPGATFFAAFIQNLANEKGINLPIVLVEVSNQKDAKFLLISSLENSFKNDRLFLCAGIRDWDKLEEEFTHFPKGRHDDRPDAIATLVNTLNVTDPKYPQNKFQLNDPFARMLAGDEFEPGPQGGSNMLGDGMVC
jgi:predicted phage terminase large subunit-like protein